MVKRIGKVHTTTDYQSPEGEKSPTPSLTSVPEEGGRLMRCSSHLTSAKEPDTQCTVGGVGPRISLDRRRQSCPHQDLILRLCNLSKLLY